MRPQISDSEARTRIARRIARFFLEQERRLVINLGVGIPTMVADFVQGRGVFIQAENGMLGVGGLATGDRIDRQLINAGRQPVLETPGCSYFDSATSFGMIRGGHVDATVIGAFEVDEEGNVANWINPNGKHLGVGGAMDLVSGAKQVIVAMQHTTRDGRPKLVKRCTMPVTGFGEVDMVMTEWGLFSFQQGSLVLEEIAPEVSLEQLTSMTEARFVVSGNLRTIREDLSSGSS